MDLQQRGASRGLLRILAYAYKKKVFMINIDRDSDDSVGDA